MTAKKKCENRQLDQATIVHMSQVVVEAFRVVLATA